jgi:hypothetical protein
MNPLAGRLLGKLQKKKRLVDPILFRRGPDFVVQRTAPRELAHIPVFTFHTAVPEIFEQQCAFLVNNGYQTIDSDEFERAMLGEIRPRARSVLLTFDDGLKQVWTVAYPILKKYGLRATVFLVPGCITDEYLPLRKTMEDVWRGTSEENEVFGIAPTESALSTWPEIREMHSSGIMDFQSHTMWHSLVYRSNVIVDFGRPDYYCHYMGNAYVPMYQSNDVDVTDRKLLLGMPIYESAPRMQTEARFFDDEGLREQCINTVQANGELAFFDNPDWKKILEKLVQKYRKTRALRERIESPEERDIAIRGELLAAKERIESELPGKKVKHLCFPWYRAKRFAHQCAVDTGHTLMYYDYKPGFYTNAPGSNTDKIARVEETFLRRLPGDGRMSMVQIVQEVSSLRNLRTRMFPN